jgi:predicted nucleic acid-binding protein
MRRLAAKVADGPERNFTIVASLVDTNILVYRCDPRFPEKRETARTLLRQGLLKEALRIPHQALVEFVSVVTRSGPDGHSLLPREEAWRQAEDILMEFPILYPDAQVVRTALHGMAAYQLSWFDAHLWAYAEHYGLPAIISEDFEHGRLYGSVRVRNPR